MNLYLPYLTLSSPPKDCQFVKLGGDYTNLQLFERKKLILKIWVNQMFKFYYEYIKNNSYINFGDVIHIRIVWSRSKAVKTHNVSYIPFKKFDNWS